MKQLLWGACIFVLTGCSSAPPADVKGQWVGWAEPAMATKTGIDLELSQDGKTVTGKYTTRQVSNLGGEEKQNGTVNGTVSGNELTLTFSETVNDIDTEPVPLTLTNSTLAGVFMHQGGIGTKYHFEKKK